MKNKGPSKHYVTPISFIFSSLNATFQFCYPLCYVRNHRFPLSPGFQFTLTVHTQRKSLGALQKLRNGQRGEESTILLHIVTHILLGEMHVIE